MSTCTLKVPELDLMSSLELPEFKRSSTLSPTSAMYDPFRNGLGSIPDALGDNPATCGWEDDDVAVDNLDAFKVPPLRNAAGGSAVLGGLDSPAAADLGRLDGLGSTSPTDSGAAEAFLFGDMDDDGPSTGRSVGVSDDDMFADEFADDVSASTRSPPRAPLEDAMEPLPSAPPARRRRSARYRAVRAVRAAAKAAASGGRDGKVAAPMAGDSGSELSKTTLSDSSDSRQTKRARVSSRKRKATPQSRRTRQENNKRAAARYRQKRKMYVQTLETQVDELNEVLDQKRQEVTQLEDRNASLVSQLRRVKEFLLRDPTGRAQAALQLFVCFSAVVLGVVACSTHSTVGGAPSTVHLSHHRSLLSVPSTPADHAACLVPTPWMGGLLWANSSGGATAAGCADHASFIITVLRTFVHLIVVPLILWVNLREPTTADKKNASAGRSRAWWVASPSLRMPISP